MYKIKKLNIFLLILMAGLLIFGPIKAKATDNQKMVNVWLFYSETCPHCKAEIEFLQKVVQENRDVKINYFEVTKNQQNSSFLSFLNKELQLNVTGVPFALIGNRDFRGFLDETTSGPAMLNAIECVRQGACKDVVTELLANDSDQKVESDQPAPTPINKNKSNSNNVVLVLALVVLAVLIGIIVMAGKKVKSE